MGKNNLTLNFLNIYYFPQDRGTIQKAELF